MTYRRTLRARVAIISGLLSLVVGLFYLVAVHVQSEGIERDVVATMLERTLDSVLAANPHPDQQPLGSKIQLYGPGLPDPPSHLRDLSPGMHEIERNGDSFEVLVQPTARGRYVMTYDEAVIEGLELRLNLGTIAVVTLAVALATLLGYYSAGFAIAPLSDFAARLQRLRPEVRAPALEPDYAQTEVGTIAAAFDRYQARIARFVERERAFTADASHEMRTPLTVIQNAAELLRVPTLPPERQQTAAKRIEQAARQMSELVDALLSVAREESGTARKRGAACRVDRVVADLVDEQRAAAERGGLQLDFDADVPVTLPVERALLAVVVGNLLRNAINFTDSGAVTITVRTQFFRIADTGPGIPDGERERVRERYYRIDDDRPGSGLGLAIANRICEVCGWRLTIEGAPGGGTTVTVSFRS